MSRKIIAAFRDPEQKCIFVRYEGGVIDLKDEDGDRWTWLGHPHDDPDPDPDGIVWAALTGQRSNEAVLSLTNLPKRMPNIAKFYADDDPLTATNCEGAIAKLERIRAAARRLQASSPSTTINVDVAALLVEVFAP